MGGIGTDVAIGAAVIAGRSCVVPVFSSFTYLACVVHQAVISSTLKAYCVIEALIAIRPTAETIFCDEVVVRSVVTNGAASVDCVVRFDALVAVILIACLAVGHTGDAGRGIPVKVVGQAACRTHICLEANVAMQAARCAVSRVEVV